jgi:cytochrome c
MRRSVLTILMVVWAVTSRAEMAVSQKELEQRGEALLATSCVGCHALGNTGSSRHPDAPRFRTLAQRGLLDSLRRALIEGRRVPGPSGQHEFTFKADEVSAIMTYLRSIQTP